MAMATRWRMPPENWCGYCCSRSAAEAMPTRESTSIERARAAWRETRSCASTVSTICVSIDRTGLSVIIGSWKIIAMRLPRSARIRSGGAPTSSSPLNRMLPPATRPGGSIRPMIENPVTDLPDPDSPTSPSTWPRPRSNDTSATAGSTPSRVANSVRRLRTSSSGAVIAPASG